MSNFKDTLKDNQYFKSLPTYVQETIMQGNANINSEEELKRYAENLMKNW